METYFLVSFVFTDLNGFGFGERLIKQLNYDEFRSADFVKKLGETEPGKYKGLVVLNFKKLSKATFENWHHKNIIIIDFN